MESPRRTGFGTGLLHKVELEVVAKVALVRRDGVAQVMEIEEGEVTVGVVRLP